MNWTLKIYDRANCFSWSGALYAPVGEREEQKKILGYLSLHFLPYFLESGRNDDPSNGLQYSVHDIGTHIETHFSAHDLMRACLLHYTHVS
jgi:hypothetical protein